MKFLFAILLLLTVQQACTQPMHREAGRRNAEAHLEKPYVFLISLDGFRWDYVQRFKPPHLSAFIAGGAQAESMISCFPSKTFPNHYSIATGMYPEHHGLVNNSFFAPEKNRVYSMGKRDIVEDGSWYHGTPLWVLAEQQGMVSASFFFVGSEADIQGIRPTYWYTYDGKVSEKQRVQQALEWLRLPEAERPHLITMYFSNMDDAGHRYGPNNKKKLRKALLELDDALGLLFDGIEVSGLPVNIIFVSDHGMAEVDVDQYMPIEKLENDDLYRTVNNGPLAHFYLNKGVSIDSAYTYLQSQATHCTIYKTEAFPHYRDSISHPRLGQLIALAEYPYYFTYSRSMQLLKTTGGKRGEHGFDPAIRDMHGIFYARGPHIKPGIVAPSFRNIHVYPFICSLLQLPIPSDIDGQADVLEALIIKN